MSQSRNNRPFWERQDAVGGIARLGKPRHDVRREIDCLQGGQQRLRDARLEIVSARRHGRAPHGVGRQVRESAVLD
jgi:hypothetical protein